MFRMKSKQKKMLQKINDKFGLLDHIVCNVGDGSSTNFNTGSLQEMDLMWDMSCQIRYKVCHRKSQLKFRLIIEVGASCHG